MTVIIKEDAVPDGDGLDPASVAAAILGTTPEKAEATSTVEGTTPEATYAERAAAAEAEFAADGKAGSEKTEAKETPEQAASRVSALQKLIDSKGGDEEKFAAGIIEQWNSTAKLADELKELKAKLAEREQPTVADTPEIDEPEVDIPDISEITTALTALDQEANANQASLNVLVAEGTAIRADILRLEGELRRADEMDQRSIKADIAEKKAELRDKKQEYNTLESRNRQIAKEKNDLGKQQKAAEREVERSKQLQQKATLTIENYKKQQRQIFSDTADAVAVEFKLDPSKHDLDYFKKTVAAQVAFTLRQNENGAPVDLAALTRQLYTEHCKKLGVVQDQAFVDKSKEKLQAAAPVKPNVASPSDTKQPNKKWTAEFAKFRAMKVLGG